MPRFWVDSPTADVLDGAEAMALYAGPSAGLVQERRVRRDDRRERSWRKQKRRFGSARHAVEDGDMSGAASATRVRAPFSPDQPYGIFVDGGEHPTPETFAAIEPSTGQEWASIPQATTDDVDRAVAAARAAFQDWRRSTPSMRQALLHALADRIEATRIGGRCCLRPRTAGRSERPGSATLCSPPGSSATSPGSRVTIAVTRSQSRTSGATSTPCASRSG